MFPMFPVAPEEIHHILASGGEAMLVVLLGLDGAVFEILIGLVARLSVVLWGLVILTTVIRSVCIRIYRRGVSRTALAKTVAPRAVVATTMAKNKAVLVSAEFVDALRTDAVSSRRAGA